MHAIATTSWNTADLLEAYLDHVRGLGFGCALVMDFHSTDGTQDILSSAKYQGFVVRVPYPGLADLDSSNVILESARRQLDGDSWCLFCDPDEFLSLPREASLQGLLDVDADGLIVPRFNMTGLRSWAADGRARDPFANLNIRIIRGARRDLPDAIFEDALTPPWIFTSVKGKVFVRVGGTTAIGPGDHRAMVRAATLSLSPEQAHLRHYPIRSYHEFEHKVLLSAADFEANPGADPLFGWHLRRWIRIAGEGGLFDEYLAQFVADDEVAALEEEGAILREPG